MFVADELVLDVSFPAAQARLVNLARRGGLSGASRAAYADELSAVIRVGPFGDAASASKLVRVRFLDPTFRGDVMTLPLRWEATGVTGTLFPALDADITLTPAGQQGTRLALAGCYRVPLGGLGAGLDRAILNHVATATIRALLRNVANSLASPDRQHSGKAGRAYPQSRTVARHHTRDAVMADSPPRFRQRRVPGHVISPRTCMLAAGAKRHRASEMPATSAGADDDAPGRQARGRAASSACAWSDLLLPARLRLGWGRR